MTSQPAYGVPTIAHLETATHVLLTEYIKQRRDPRGIAQDLGPNGLIPLSQVPTGETADIHDAASDPIRWALRSAICRLGRYLYDAHKAANNGGNALTPLIESAERIAEMDPAAPNERSATLDKLFDGIGDGSDIWMA